MTAGPPAISLHSWTLLSEEGSRVSTRLVLRSAEEGDRVVAVTLERCAFGRLREAYPVGEHDIEVRVSDQPPAVLIGLLGDLVAAVLDADLCCRRVVFAAPEGDLEILAAVEEAGFRYVVDVDLPDGTVSLAVFEPAWVTSVDIGLEQVPHS